MTAAHCLCKKCYYIAQEKRSVIQHKKISAIKAIIGEKNKFQGKNQKDQYEVDELIIHPEYKPLTCKEHCKDNNVRLVRSISDMSDRITMLCWVFFRNLTCQVFFVNDCFIKEQAETKILFTINHYLYPMT